MLSERGAAAGRRRPRARSRSSATKVLHRRRGGGVGGLTVINESLNVGKHFISASSVFIRPVQPLAGRERAGTFITATRPGGGEGGGGTSHRSRKNTRLDAMTDSSPLLLPRRATGVINETSPPLHKDDRCFGSARACFFSSAL